MDVFDEAGLEQHRVGDDEDALEAVMQGDLAELVAGAGTEEERTGGVIGPGGTHAISVSGEED